MGGDIGKQHHILSRNVVIFFVKPFRKQALGSSSASKDKGAQAQSNWIHPPMSILLPSPLIKAPQWNNYLYLHAVGLQPNQNGAALSDI